MLKKVEVRMLPTKIVSQIAKSNYGKYLYLYRGDKDYLYERHCTYQQLYILSDEEIKEGDWVLWNNSNTIEHVNKVGSNLLDFTTTHLRGYIENCKKVIASTDKTLIYGTTTSEGDYKNIHKLPEVRESFVRVFMEAYNNGKPIEKVNIEYQVMVYPRGNKPDFEAPKLRSDNTIIIHPIKDSFTREEIYDILHEYGSANCPNPYYKGRRQAISWFNENY